MKLQMKRNVQTRKNSIDKSIIQLYNKETNLNPSSSNISGSITNNGLVQRVSYNGSILDISQLNSEECKEHLARISRVKAGHPKVGDTDYAYDNDDSEKLVKRKKEALNKEISLKHSTLISNLDTQLTHLATSSSFTVDPPWMNLNPAPGSSNETYSPGKIKADVNTIVSSWCSFLGKGPYSNLHPRLGSSDNSRLVSGNGQRSIRYGIHEKTSKPTLHHFHEESWSYDQPSNKVNVDNLVKRAPVT